LKAKLSIPAVQDIELDVPGETDINTLKRKACERIGIEPELTSVIHNGRRVDGRRRLRELRLGQNPLVLDYLWARHLILWGQQGQKRLRKATVLLAGAGAISNEVAKNLAMLGVRRLVIVDNDIVELSNTGRMIFFDPKSQGLNKAKVLARNVTSKFPRVEAMAWTGTLETLPLEYLLGSDVMVCGLDNLLSRVYLAQMSKRYSIPMVDGGIIGYQGRVQVYAPPEMPCPLCTFPSTDYARTAGLRNPCDGPLEETKVPSLPTTISLVSSIQSQEAVKLIIGYREFLQKGIWPATTGEPLKAVLMIDLRHNRYSLVDVKRNKKCVVCGDKGVAGDPVPTLQISVKHLRDSTSRLYEAVAREMRLPQGNTMLFVQKQGKSFRVEKGRSLRKLGLGGRSILTLVTQTGPDYSESVVRLSET
jgi:adenylyltransferase/sulfurtransferase